MTNPTIPIFIFIESNDPEMSSTTIGSGHGTITSRITIRVSRGIVAVAFTLNRGIVSDSNFKPLKGDVIISILIPESMSVINAVSNCETSTKPDTINSGINNVSITFTFTVSRKSSIRDGLHSTIRLILRADVFCETQHPDPIKMNPTADHVIDLLNDIIFNRKKVRHKFPDRANDQNDDRDFRVFGCDRVGGRHCGHRQKGVA